MDRLILPDIKEGEDKSFPFLNCLRNRYKHIRKFAKRFETDCVRIYDREIAAFPLAIDLYAGRFAVHYFARSKDLVEPPSELVVETERALAALFGATQEQIFWRTRIRRKETRQYEKAATAEEFFIAHEGKADFYINLTDYLDTGLFIDHRALRKLVADEAKGKRLLNLFAYTGAFTVQAALKGAISSKTVDLSNTYTDWAKRNFLLNGLSLKEHQVIRADCMLFLKEERAQYDLIVIDPPTISRSKKMLGLFDVQQDYVFLIKHSLKLLAKGGRLYFSTNSRKFQFDPSLFPECKVHDISKQTRPEDFNDPLIHRSWRLTENSGKGIPDALP